MSKALPGGARVTMREIARAAGGVHPSTVSLALRNSPSISLAQRKRIQATATKLGYRRDPWLDAFNVRRLKNLPHRVNPVIAFVVDVESRRELAASPRLGALWRGATTAAEALHHRLEPFFLGSEAITAKRLENILQARGIDGLVMAAMRSLGPQPALVWEHYSAVKVDCLDWSLPGYTVSGDLRQGARIAVRRARELGYHRVGLAISSARETNRNELLTAGYLIEQNTQAESKTIPVLVTEQCPSPRKLHDWIRKHRVDAVLSDWTALGEVLAERKAAAGEKVAWACLDATDAANDVAGVIVPHERVGALAIEQVVNLLRTNQRGSFKSASSTFVPVSWRDGPTMPKVAAL